MPKPVYAFNKAQDREEESIKEVLDQHAALSKKYSGLVERRRKSERFKRYLDDIKINRTYARGEQHEDDGEGIVRANLIHPELKKFVNETYAKDPDIAITPTESVDPGRYEGWRNYGKTIELVLRSELSPENANLKAKAKRRIRAADTAGYGWLKVVYQTHIEKDPVIDQRIHDTQDDIQRLDAAYKALNDDEIEKESDEYYKKKQELEDQLSTLQSQVEISRAEGLTFSVRQTENVTWSEEVKAPEDMSRAPWIDDMIWMTESDAEAKFGWMPEEAKRYDRDGDDSEGNEVANREDNKEYYVCIHEFWHLPSRKIYTMINGFDGFLRDPYNPTPMGERFHGMFALCFDAVDGDSIPLPLVTQLRSLQDEHNTARTNFREHREKSVPFSVAHGGELGPDSVKKLSNPSFMETVVLEDAPQGLPIESVFKAVQSPPINPAVYDTNHVRTDWESVTHRGDAARGMTAKTKTATEAEILQGNLLVDTSERKDAVEEDLRDILAYCMQLVVQSMSTAQVRRIAGESAQWYQFDKREVFDMVSLEIRAGSTGKPDRQLELEKWLRVLPELRDTLMSIIEMRSAGKDKEASLLMKLARISLERFDERLDIEALIPEEEESPQELLEKERQQKEQMIGKLLKMKEMISNIANTDADTMSKVADAEAKEVGVQIDEYMAIMQTLLNQQQPGANNVQSAATKAVQ